MMQITIPTPRVAWLAYFPETFASTVPGLRGLGVIGRGVGNNVGTGVGAVVVGFGVGAGVILVKHPLIPIFPSVCFPAGHCVQYNLPVLLWY